MDSLVTVTEWLLAPAWRLAVHAAPSIAGAIYRAHPKMTLGVGTLCGLATALWARREARRRRAGDQAAVTALAGGEVAALALAQRSVCLLSAMAWNLGPVTTTALTVATWVARAYTHYRLLLVVMDLAVVQAMLYVLWRVWRRLLRSYDVQGLIMFAIVKVMTGGDVIAEDSSGGGRSVNAMAQLVAAGLTVRCGDSGITDAQAREVQNMMHQPLEPGECLICRDEDNPCATRLNCCSQYVHAACALDWVKDHPSCPHCRRSLPSGALLALRHLQRQFLAHQAARAGRPIMAILVPDTEPVNIGPDVDNE